MCGAYRRCCYMPAMLLHACACGDGPGLRASRPARPHAHTCTGTLVSREPLKFQIPRACRPSHSQSKRPAGYPNCNGHAHFDFTRACAFPCGRYQLEPPDRDPNPPAEPPPPDHPHNSKSPVHCGRYRYPHMHSRRWRQRYWQRPSQIQAWHVGVIPAVSAAWYCNHNTDKHTSNTQHQL